MTREPALFPLTFTVDRDGGPVTPKGRESPACAPRFLMVGGGRTFVSKRIITTGELLGGVSPSRALAEFVVAQAAAAFGIAAPTPAFLDFRGELWVGSEWLPETSPLLPSVLARLEPADGVSRLFALDVLIENHDRHNGNVLFARIAEGERSMRLYAIDHEKSSLAYDDDEGSLGESFCRINMLFDPDLLVVVDRDAAAQAAQEAAAVLLADGRIDEYFTQGRAWCGQVLHRAQETLGIRLAKLPLLVADAYDGMRGA